MLELREELRRPLEAALHGARSILSRRADVDDAVQEALLRWLKRLAEGRAPAVPEAWMFRVGQSEALKLLARERRGTRGEVPVEDLAVECAASADGEESSRWSGIDVLRMFSVVLTARQREVVRAAIEPGASMHEAARRVGMDSSTFRRELLRAGARIRRRMAPPEDQ